MKVTWGLDHALANESTITTVGSYDGVHLGHEKIIERLIFEKRRLGLDRSLLVTFDPHPQQILKKTGESVPLLTTIDERLALLANTGIDEVLVIRFDEDLAKRSYVEFFERILMERLGMKALVVGFNHALGKDREGDPARLKALGETLSVPVFEVPPLSIAGVSLSSTKIRKAMLAGDLRLVNEYLGHTYSFSGEVIHGDHLGRTLGYPTANLRVTREKLLPAEGVYVCKVKYAGRQLEGALSIGKRPTIGDNLELAVEVFLFDFNEELYGATLVVECLAYLRPQEIYPDLDALREQITRDVEQAKDFLTASAT